MQIYKQLLRWVQVFDVSNRGWVYPSYQSSSCCPIDSRSESEEALCKINH